MTKTIPCYFFERIIKVIINKMIEKEIQLATITEGLSINKPYTNQLKVPVPITRYMLSDKPSAVLYFHILNACGKKADVVSVAAIKPIYYGCIMLDNNIHNLSRDDNYLFRRFPS